MTTATGDPTTATDAEVPEPERFGLKGPAGPHPLTQPRIWVPLAVLLFILNIPFIHLALRGPAKVTTTIPFQDDYSRTELGDNYFSTGGLWRIVNGQVYAPGVKNNPLWLRAKLPHDVVVEFDARTESSSGDVRAEIFGNGRDHPSGYILTYGSTSTLAKLDEKARDRKESHARKPERGRMYHWKIVRDGAKLSWYIDGDLFLEDNDPHPLSGPDHDRFGFDTWVTDAYFDNLTIQPLR